MDAWLGDWGMRGGVLAGACLPTTPQRARFLRCSVLRSAAICSAAIQTRCMHPPRRCPIEHRICVSRGSCWPEQTGSRRCWLPLFLILAEAHHNTTGLPGSYLMHPLHTEGLSLPPDTWPGLLSLGRIDRVPGSYCMECLLSRSLAERISPCQRAQVPRVWMPGRQISGFVVLQPSATNPVYLAIRRTLTEPVLPAHVGGRCRDQSTPQSC
jgi:hypothetical protein